MSDVSDLIEEVQGLVEAAKLGSGARFKALTKEIEKDSSEPGHKKVRDPAAVAAAIGRKKYGAKKMSAMSAAGRKG